MRTTINIDDDLLDHARRITGLTSKTVIVQEALRALIQRESARRLAELGGTEQKLKAARRRRAEPQ